MPPADQDTPTSAPAPEAPKPERVGFFARLFGKKPKENTVPEGHESQTPPAQLSESPVGDGAPLDNPSDSLVSGPVVESAAPVADEMPSMPESNASDEEEGTPSTLDVPPSVSSEEPKPDEGMVVPPVQGASSTDESAEKPSDPSVPKL